MMATLPLPPIRVASLVPPTTPALKLPVPTKAIRLEPGRSASTVTTGMPWLTALSTMEFSEGSKPTTTRPSGFLAMACSKAATIAFMSYSAGPTYSVLTPSSFPTICIPILWSKK